MLGSNMGEPKRTVEKACSEVKARIGEVVASSAMFCSQAWGFESPDMFVNQALKVSSVLSPLQVLSAIHAIEESLGRVRVPTSGYVSRTIDIDILHWNGGIFSEEKLTIPHPRVSERRFALMPMCQIAGALIHPDTGLSYQELMSNCSDKGTVFELVTAA